MTDAEGRYEGCPQDEHLVALVEGRLVGVELARVQRHVATCRDCLDVLAAGMSSAASAEPDVVRPAVVPRAGWRGWAIAAGAVLVAGALVAGMLRGSTPAVTQAVVRLVGVDASVESLGVRLGSPPGTVLLELRGVTTRGMRLGTVTATLALTAPFAGDRLVQRVHLAAPELDLSARDPAVLFGTAAGRARTLAALETARVGVDGGRLRLPGPTGMPVVLEDLAGVLERRNGTARLALRGRSGGGTFDVAGTIVGDGRTVSVTVGGRGLDAAAVPLLGAAMQGALDGRLSLRAEADTWRADGRLLVRDGRVVGYGPARVSAASPALLEALGAAAPELAGDDLVFDEARVAFAWRRGVWRLPRVFLTRSGVEAGGRARIDPTGTVRGRGTVRLPAGLVRRIDAEGVDLAGWRASDGGATVPVILAGSVASPVLGVDGP